MSSKPLPKYLPRRMPNRPHHMTRTQSQIQTESEIRLRTHRLLLQSSFLYPDRPWHGENCFGETSESSTRSPHASYDASSSYHHQNLSSCPFESWIHVFLTHSFWKICDVCWMILCVNAWTCVQFPTEGNQQ